MKDGRNKGAYEEVKRRKKEGRGVERVVRRELRREWGREGRDPKGERRTRMCQGVTEGGCEGGEGRWRWRRRRRRRRRRRGST